LLQLFFPDAAQNSLMFSLCHKTNEQIIYVLVRLSVTVCLRTQLSNYR